MRFIPIAILMAVSPVLHAQNMHSAGHTNQSANAAVQPLDTASIERITGIKGKSNNGAYKITVPQNDLNITVDSFKIIPAMGLGTWVAFAPAPDGAMIMGDL